MRIAESVGRRTLGGLRELRYYLAVAVTALARAARPSTWTRPSLRVLVVQIYFTGVQAIWHVLLLAVFVGVAVVLQGERLLRGVGQSELLGPFFVVSVVNGIGPLAVNTLVLVRSGSAIVSELATMTVGGEVRVVEALGLDAFDYLVVPRVLAMILSVLGLAVIFLVATLTTGYLASFLFLGRDDTPLGFVNLVLRSLGPADFAMALANCALPALATAVVCTTVGLSAEADPTAVPRASTAALLRSVLALAGLTVGVSAVGFL